MSSLKGLNLKGYCLESSGNGAVTERPCPFTLDTGNAQSSDLNYSQLSSYVSRRDLNMKRKMLKLEAPG